MLWQIARLRLRPIAIHPDRCGGLAFFSEPAIGFAYVILAISAVQSAVWADRVVFMGADVAAFKTDVGVMLVLSALVALGPLLAYVPTLWRARFAGDREYGELATDYTRQFHTRWIVGHQRERLLGAPDIRSLADLANSFDIMLRMRVIPFGARALVVIAAAVLAPTIPLVLRQIPFDELVRKIGGLAMGGLPM